MPAELKSSGQGQTLVLTISNPEHRNALAPEIYPAGIEALSVAETVPDAVLKGADAVELVDIPPAELLERMRSGGFNVGGEQSGHMIMLDHATTGDGTIAALQVLAALVKSGKRASELLHLFDPVPQLLKNVRFSGGKPLEAASVRAVIADAEAALAGRGRLVIRPSGTEPVIRVMAEGDDAGQVEQAVDAICDAVREAAA